MIIAFKNGIHIKNGNLPLMSSPKRHILTESDHNLTVTMHKITFISTIHREIGKCNSEELFKVIEGIAPKVVFLEADDQTYSSYDQYLHSTYGVYHHKLEIAAIQKYGHIASFEYVTVCDVELSDAFHKKIKITCQDIEMQNLIDNFKALEAQYGFMFLNSQECVDLQEEMRVLEDAILNNDALNKEVKANIEDYENSMIRNIYYYSRDNKFDSAIFMCGAAHRKSIIEKIEKSNTAEQLNLTWTVFGS